MVENPLLEFRTPYEMTNSDGLFTVIVTDSDVIIENIFPPDDLTNIIIALDDNTELHLNKDILRSHSRVFKAMFNGDNFKEGKYGAMELPGKKTENVILFLSYFYPERTIPLEDEVDYFGLLQLCDEYQVDWMKKKIKDHMVQRLQAFFHGPEFVHKTRLGTGGLEYRYADFRYKADFRRSYDDTLVVYFMYLDEQFNLTDVLEWSLDSIFELELCDLQKIKLFELLSEPTKLHIYRYCIKRGIAAQGRNPDEECEEALNNCVDSLTGG